MDFQAIIIGSGFGGAVNACRLAKRWPGEVLVFERGKRYPMGSFARSPDEMSRNFWCLPDENVRRPKAISSDEQHGLFDVRNFRHLDTVTGAGYGGGSLIYANVFMQPPNEVFQHWPDSCNLDTLAPYYEVAKTVLGARPIPITDEPRRKVKRTAVFENVAVELGRKSELTDINVFFGNNFEQPLAIGEQDRNRYGALQTSCIYCAECDAGCNTHSKNTVDLNYLYAAETRYNLAVRTEHIVTRIESLNAAGEADSQARGNHGYRVHYKDLTSNQRSEQSYSTRRVVIAAGAVGSTELLLRCKHEFQTLPHVSERLGSGFSANGDFLSVVVDADECVNSNYGPVITQRIDVNLFEHFDPTEAFIIEDAGYPSFASWFIQGAKPGLFWLGPLWRAIRAVLTRFFSGRDNGHIGYAIADLLKADISAKSAVLLCMGLDASDGTISLDRNGYADIKWPYRSSMRLYRGMLNIGKRFKSIVGAKVFFAMPTWYWPLRKNVCVHALGGCGLGDDTSTGVTSADPDKFGEVFGYEGLFVADGAMVPRALGANPSATITALAERVAQGITGVVPDADL